MPDCTIYFTAVPPDAKGVVLPAATEEECAAAGHYISENRCRSVFLHTTPFEEDLASEALVPHQYQLFNALRAGSEILFKAYDCAFWSFTLRHG